MAALLALDITGGVVTNATGAAKRWYHRPGQGFKQHFLFTAIHLLQLAVVGWLFRGDGLVYVAVLYPVLLLGAVCILAAPLRIRRPTAMACYAAALAVSLYVTGLTPGLEWFEPLFFLKLFVAHLLDEAPFE